MSRQSSFGAVLMEASRAESAQGVLDAHLPGNLPEADIDHIAQSTGARAKAIILNYACRRSFSTRRFPAVMLITEAKRFC